MNQTENYIIGEFYPYKGHYHKCPVCGEYFFGRDNKIYCSDPCRFKKNNTINKERRLETKDENIATRNNFLLLKKHYITSQGKTPVNAGLLKDPTFNLKAPCKQLKHDETGVTIYFYHGYGFFYDKKTETIIIYKKDDLH